MTRGLYDRSGRMRQILEVEPWALYVAQAKGVEGGVVKVGVTMDPPRRARDMLRDGHAIERFVWAWCGGKETAHQLQAFIHQGFKARRLPGEWFGFDFASAADKREFNGVVQQAYMAMVERPLKWTAVDNLAELRALAREPKRRPTVRRLEYSGRSRRP